MIAEEYAENQHNKIEKCEVGAKIKIIDMKGEPAYNGKEGVVTHIDGIGQLHGTWGGLAIQPENDVFEIGKVCCICGKSFFGFGNNPSPVKESGECCDSCNSSIVLATRLRF